MAQQITYQQSALTADATSQGVVTVANSLIFPIAGHVFLSATALPILECQIVARPTPTTLTLTKWNTNQSTLLNLTGYTVAASATLTMPPQETFTATDKEITGNLQVDENATIDGNLDVAGVISGSGSGEAVNQITLNDMVGGNAPTVISQSNGLLTFSDTDSSGGTYLNIDAGSAGQLGIYSDISQTSAGRYLAIFGNVAASDTSTDVIALSSVARTAGSIFAVGNNSLGGLFGIDYKGTASINGGAEVTGLLEVTDLQYPTGIGYSGTSAAGTLPAATYYYRISALNWAGQSLASPETSFMLTATGSVIITWNPVVGAASYNVYGRTTGAELLIGSVAFTSTLTFTDDGSVTPSGALPTSNTTGGMSASNIQLGTPGHLNSGDFLMAYASGQQWFRMGGDGQFYTASTVHVQGASYGAEFMIAQDNGGAIGWDIDSNVADSAGNTATRIKGSLTSTGAALTTSDIVQLYNATTKKTWFGPTGKLNGTPNGADSWCGTATLTSSTVTIATTAVTASSIIVLSYITPHATPGQLSAPAASISAGVQFVVNSSLAGDSTSTFSWLIIN